MMTLFFSFSACSYSLPYTLTEIIKIYCCVNPFHLVQLTESEDVRNINVYTFIIYHFYRKLQISELNDEDICYTDWHTCTLTYIHTHTPKVEKFSSIHFVILCQCSNGHLMCAGCFTHLLADARIRDETATCPNCRVEISRSLATRNLGKN